MMLIRLQSERDDVQFLSVYNNRSHDLHYSPLCFKRAELISNENDEIERLVNTIVK